MAKKKNKLQPKNKLRLPRKKKKELQKQAGKLSTPELLEVQQKQKKKNKRSNSSARLYNEKRAYLRDKNLPPELITKRDSWEVVQAKAAAYEKQRRILERQQKENARFLDKIERLTKAGFSKEEARKIAGRPTKQISYDKLNHIIEEKTKPPINAGFKVKTKDYLYVAFASTNDSLGLDYNNWSVDEMLDFIRDRLHEARLNPTGSGSMTGVFKIEHGSKSAMLKQAQYYHTRGYNFDPAQGALRFDGVTYNKLTLHNQYSQQAFLELVCTVLGNAKNEMVNDYFTEFQDYCTDNNLPFLNKL